MKKIKGRVNPENSKIHKLQNKVNELEALINAIQRGEVDSLLIKNKKGTESLVTLEGEDQPYRNLIETLSEGAITLSEEGVFIHCNNKFSNMINIPVKEIINSSIYDYVPKIQHGSLSKFLSIKNIDYSNSEFTLQGNNTTLSVLLTYHNVSFGKVKGLSLIVTDISNWKNEQVERIKVQKELIKNQELFHQFADNVNIVFWRMSAALDSITYISPAYENMWGLSCDNLYLNPFEWLNSVYEEDKKKAILFLEKLKTQEDNSTTYKILSADGITKHISAKGFQVKNQQGIVLCICGICTDITELAIMKERSHLADKLNTIGTLATGIVHEVNNPVTWVLANLEFIKKKATTLEPNKLDEILNESIQGAKQIRDIVTSLKGFARVDNNEMEDVNLLNIFDSVLKIAASEIKLRALVEKKFANNLPLIKANPGRLQQVFLNLIMNAAQAIPPGNVENNKICIVISKERKKIRIDICDTGVGIEPDKLSKIFDPFYTNKSPGIGTGLGLSITHEIIKSFGGEITVQSTLKKGSTFSVLLPLPE